MVDTTRQTGTGSAVNFDKPVYDSDPNTIIDALRNADDFVVIARKGGRPWIASTTNERNAADLYQLGTEHLQMEGTRG